MIAALDTDRLSEACRWVEGLQGTLEFFKVGSQLFTREGPHAVTAIRERGGKVFLDLKFHDIPNTVRRAVRAAAALGVTFVNVHASGGRDMLRAALEGAQEGAVSSGAAAPDVLAVTLLTSLDTPDLETVGLRGTAEDCVLRLAELAVEAGVRGLVASPREVAALRRALGEEILLITPGIRTGRIAGDDQQRVMGPRYALDAGADFLVMGRSLLDASDPVVALKVMLA